MRSTARQRGDDHQRCAGWNLGTEVARRIEADKELDVRTYTPLLVDDAKANARVIQVQRREDTADRGWELRREQRHGDADFGCTRIRTQRRRDANTNDSRDLMRRARGHLVGLRSIVGA